MGSRLPATIPSPPNLERKTATKLSGHSLNVPSTLTPKQRKSCTPPCNFFSFALFFSGLPQIHIKIGMESNENLSQIDKVRKKHALDKILP